MLEASLLSGKSMMCRSSSSCVCVLCGWLLVSITDYIMLLGVKVASLLAPITYKRMKSGLRMAETEPSFRSHSMQEVGFHDELSVVQRPHLNAENFPWKICSMLNSYNNETCDESDFGKHYI